jgi:hypothetical protein
MSKVLFHNALAVSNGAVNFCQWHVDNFTSSFADECARLANARHHLLDQVEDALQELQIPAPEN